ncbi:hypothetical protein Vi05172_g6830 [Venturia inaequalis]|nr:hypothetical protein Vi05172_g6830 [Venturia inaequalis]
MHHGSCLVVAVLNQKEKIGKVSKNDKASPAAKYRHLSNGPPTNIPRQALPLLLIETAAAARLMRSNRFAVNATLPGSKLGSRRTVPPLDPIPA